MSICRTILQSLALLGAFAVFASTDAWAQATDLVCDKCVGTSDIAVGAVRGGRIANGSVNSSKIKNGAVTGGKIATGAVTSGRIANGAVNSSKIGSGAVTSGKIQSGAVNFAKLDSSVQLRIEDLESQLGAVLNPPACTSQTLNGLWQTYAVHADELDIEAGWTRCQLTMTNGGSTVSGPCTNELGENFTITGGSLTISSQCRVTGNLAFTGTGFTSSATIAHAFLDLSRNILTGVGFGSDVGPLMTTAVRR